MSSSIFDISKVNKDMDIRINSGIINDDLAVGGNISCSGNINCSQNINIKGNVNISGNIIVVGNNTKKAFFMNDSLQVDIHLQQTYQEVPLNNMLINNSNFNYTNSSYACKIPVDGIYNFYYQTICEISNASNIVSAGIFKNGTIIQGSLGKNQLYEDYALVKPVIVSNSCLSECDANDIIQLKIKLDGNVVPDFFATTGRDNLIITKL